jgi:hypothetical protein
MWTCMRSTVGDLVTVVRRIGMASGVRTNGYEDAVLQIHNTPLVQALIHEMIRTSDVDGSLL